MQTTIIRKATLEDLPALVEIYNQAILAHQTADTIPFKTEARKCWFDAHQDARYPLYLSTDSQVVMGYLTLSKYREARPALRGVVEISYYVHQAHQRRGIGSALLQFGLQLASDLGFKHAFAILLDTNLPSIGLLKKFDFEQWGHLPNIAEINGRVCGQLYYGRKL